VTVIQKQKRSLFFGAFIIFILSALFHFLYDTTGIFFTTFFSAINESVFQHIKITYFASLLYAFYLYYYIFEQDKSLIAGTFFGLSFIYIFIPTVFYGYTSLLGTHNLLIDLLIAFLAGVGFLATNYIFVVHGYFKKQSVIFKYALIALTLFTSYFTYYPPNFEMFLG